MISRSFERPDRTASRATDTRNRYKIRYTRIQHRPVSRHVNYHGRVSGTHTGFEGGDEYDQRGPDGTGGLVSIGPDQCPSAARQPDGKCPIGWLAGHILVTANTEFLEANPAAKLLFTAVRLTVLEVSLAAETLRRTGADPDDLAAQWIAENRDRADTWLAAAREATE